MLLLSGSLVLGQASPKTMTPTMKGEAAGSNTMESTPMTTTASTTKKV